MLRSIAVTRVLVVRILSVSLLGVDFLGFSKKIKWRFTRIAMILLARFERVERDRRVNERLKRYQERV